MTLREQLYDGLDMVAVVGPVAPEVLAALPEALAAHAATSAGRPLRRRRTPSGRWAGRPVDGIGDVARSSVVVHDRTDLTPNALAVACQRDGYRGLPLAIHVSGTTMAVMSPHDLFDGTAGWDQFERIMLQLAGMPAASPPRVLRFPVLASMRASGLLDRSALARARVVRRQAERSTVTAPQAPEPRSVDLRGRDSALTCLWIDPAGTRGLRDSLAPATAARPRESLHMLVTGLVLDALRSSTSPAHDFRVRMNVDLRRYAPDGATVLGPFSTSYPFGTLRGIDTAPLPLAATMLAALESRGPLWALVGNLVGYVKARAVHPGGLPRSTTRSTFDVGLSILPARLPAEFWAPHGDPVNAAMLFHPRLPSDPYVQIAHVHGGMSISLWDEVGLVDGEAFATAVRAALAARGQTGVA